MKTKLAGAVCLGATVACSAIAAAQAPPLAPYRLSESFDGGSVGAWSSYPPAQDTAYDPTIWVKPLVGERATADRALYREITPLNPVDYEFGVRKLVHLHVDQTSVLTFRAYVDAANGTSGMRLRFGFADGSDETVDVPFTTTRAWVEGRVELDAVVGAGPPRELTAIAFIATCPEAAPGAPYRFGLDDVTLTGWRPPVWTFVDPPAHELVELREAVAGRHFQYGDTLRLHVRAPVSVERPRLHVSSGTGGPRSRSPRPRVSAPASGGRRSRPRRRMGGARRPASSFSCAGRTRRSGTRVCCWGLATPSRCSLGPRRDTWPTSGNEFRTRRRV